MRMRTRTPDDSRRWSDEGTKLFLDAATGIEDEAYDAPSRLPGWIRRHLVAHVAANADALGNLVRWAATGVPTPMYASAEERAAGIARGPRLSAAELDRWLRRSAAELSESTGRLTDEQWSAEVVTAQGRTVPASEIPWLRAREVCVHAVDLGLGVTFADLPDDFLEALVADVVARRGEVPVVDGPLAERAAWLTGRPHRLSGAPDLGAWL
jgi:maleylpyruvate isomerase